MNHDDLNKQQLKLSRRADIAADVAGYLLVIAILAVMFGLSGSLY